MWQQAALWQERLSARQERQACRAGRGDSEITTRRHLAVYPLTFGDVGSQQCFRFLSTRMNALMRDAKDGTLDVNFEEAMCVHPLSRAQARISTPSGRTVTTHRYVLRVAAANRKLDMSDAFETVAGPGVMTNMGVMTKGRFQAAMSDIFKGIPQAVLTLISRGYGTGDVDRHDPGGYVHVKFKQALPPYALETAVLGGRGFTLGVRRRIRTRQAQASAQRPAHSCAQCPMPNAQCPMPNAQCPMPNAQ